jgi:two-component system response regulator HydG
MRDTGRARDKPHVLRAQLAETVTPTERIKAALLLAEEIWLSDTAAAEPLLEQVVAASEKTGLIADGARAASMLSELLRRAGDRNASARYADMVLKAADATGDRRIRAGGLNLVGLIHQERGEHQRAIECFEEFLKISRETGFTQGERSALNQLAGIYGLQGEADKALKCYQQGLAASTEAGDSYSRATYSYNIGWTLESMGRWTEAAEHFYRTIAISEEQGFNDLLLAARMALGELSLKRSDCENAALMFGAVVEAERKAQHSGQVLREALADLGWTHFRCGNLAHAEKTLDEASRLSETAEDRCLLASLSRRRAELALAQGRLDAAGELLARAARHASDLNLRKEQGEVLRVEALLAAARKGPDAALAALARAESTLEPLGDTCELALTRLRWGSLLIELQRCDEALPLLQTAARTFRRLSVMAEAEEANRLLYRLEARTDRDEALLRGLAALSVPGLAPELFIERALALLCGSFEFEQGAVLVESQPVALRGNPRLDRLPRRLTLTQSDFALHLPVKQGRALLGRVWLRRELPLATRVESALLEKVSRTLAPSLSRLKELETLEADRAPQIPGLRFRGVVGCNREVLGVLTLVPSVAGAAVSVLIRGESGTGKELVARALHESGARADRPFVTVNCAAVPEGLLEAEFFGVEAGAATGVAARPGKFERAHGGTIFLDEIGDMSPALQAKLLRVIEDKTITRVGGSEATPVNVCVIAATNKNLDLRMSEGLFRADLFYRLNTLQLVLPPLRHRCEDLPALTQYFIARTAQAHNRTVRRASDEVMALFAEYAWPGNIRQLQHVVERAVLLSARDTIQVADLPSELKEAGSSSSPHPAVSISGARRRAADEAERAMLLDVLRRAGGRATEARKLTGYSRTHFYRLLRRYHISNKDKSE